MKGKLSEKGQKAMKTQRRWTILRLTSYQEDGATATTRPGCRAQRGQTREEDFPGTLGPLSSTVPSGVACERTRRHPRPMST